jgi:hypothetical protein
MKLASLHLAACGPFTGPRLDFPAPFTNSVLDPRDPALFREALTSAEAHLLGAGNARAAGAGNCGARR